MSASTDPKDHIGHQIAETIQANRVLKVRCIGCGVDLDIAYGHNFTTKDSADYNVTHVDAYGSEYSVDGGKTWRPLPQRDP